jgi:ketosteroid isomerase-like protein
VSGDDTPRVADELGVRRTIAEYCHRVDDGEFAALVDLFTPDAELVYGALTMQGSDALLQFFSERQARPEQRGRHLTLNTVVDVHDDIAHAVSDYLQLMAPDGAPVPARAGRYRDEFVRDGDRWRFRRRTIEPWPAPAG